MTVPVDLWAVPLQNLDLRVATIGSFLPKEEQDRILSYNSKVSANISIVSYATLRCVLQSYLGIPARDVVVDRACQICGEPHGRPRVPGQQLAFSVSHSSRLIVVAVAASGKIGVDVEHAEAKGVDAVRDIALGAIELASLRPLDASSYKATLRRLWVRKEAVLKAYGIGLLEDPRNVLSPPSTLDAVQNAPVLPPYNQVLLTDFDVADHFGALATSAPTELHHRDGVALLRRTLAASGR